MAEETDRRERPAPPGDATAPQGGPQKTNDGS